MVRFVFRNEDMYLSEFHASFNPSQVEFTHVRHLYARNNVSWDLRTSKWRSSQLL
jgi:hypothetical protein